MSAGREEFATFVVRLSRAGGGGLHGIVERVRTGEKVRFHGLDALGAVIAGMLADDDGTRGQPTGGG